MMEKQYDPLTQVVPGTGSVEHIQAPKIRFNPLEWIGIWLEQRASRQKLQVLAEQSIREGNKAKMLGKT